MPDSTIPLDPGGQNQQCGQGPRTGRPCESCVFDWTEVADHVMPGGNVVKVVRAVFGGIVVSGPSVLVPITVLPLESVAVVGTVLC